MDTVGGEEESKLGSVSTNELNLYFSGIMVMTVGSFTENLKICLYLLIISDMH